MTPLKINRNWIIAGILTILINILSDPSVTTLDISLTFGVIFLILENVERKEERDKNEITSISKT